MFRFLTGGDEHMLGLIMGPGDLVKFREKPMLDHVLIDGSQYEHPEAAIFITYARSGSHARAHCREHLSRNGPAGSLMFSGARDQQKLIGIVLTEPQAVRYEAEPLNYFETFDGKRFGTPGLNILLSYANDDAHVVRFMKELGVPYSQFATDPNLRPLWERFEEVSVSNALRLARLGGRAIPERPTNFTALDQMPAGMSESAILAARGQDLAWFRAHPRETEYLRPVVPGEMPPETKAEYVKVIQLPETTKGRSDRLKIPMKRVNGELVEAKGEPHG